MAARRALLENDSLALDDLADMVARHSAARRALGDSQNAALLGVGSEAAARRAIATPISFDPDEPLITTRPLPRITVETPLAAAARPSIRLRRGLLGAAAAATASAALIMPNAMSTVTAQPVLSQPALTQTAAAETRTVATTRDVQRTQLTDDTELLEPITLAQADAADAAEAARVAEEQRLAAEVAAAEAARIAEEQRLAEEQRIAAEKAAAEAKAAEEAAAAAQATPAASTNTSSTSSYVNGAPAQAPTNTGYCAFGDGSNMGLTYQAQAAFQAVCAQFPNVSSYGGWRASADDHGAGQAIDIMISGPAGWEIANWLVANASWLNVEYVIYSQSIWGNWAPGAGFTMMENRGSVTANHYDHVHVTIR